MDSLKQHVNRIWRELNVGRKTWDQWIGWPARIGGFIFLFGVVTAERALTHVALFGMFVAFVVEQVRLIRRSQ